jgi:class 3 adenylate cyclase
VVNDTPKTSFARSSNGASVAYQVLGDGPLDLLLMGGGPFSIDSADEEPSLARFQRQLASFSRLVRYDTRGSGLSDPASPANPPTLEDWMDDALAVMDAVSPGRWSLLGVALSAMQAIMVAAAHPDRVRSLVIVNGTARLVAADDYPIGAPSQLMDEVRDGPGFDPAAFSDVHRQYLSAFAPSAAGDTAFADWYIRARNRFASPAMHRAIYLVSVDQVDVRELLPMIGVPTLVVHRRDCRVLRPEHGRYLAERIDGSRYVELPGADFLYWLGDTSAMLGEIEEFLTGTRPASTADRVLATVLFSDIVDSTAQASVVGDRAWRDRLDAHDAMVRRQLGRFRGREVNTIGDGFLATFDGPARAIECACAIRDGAHQLGMDVRVGLHTGEVELRGDDIVGLAVNVAARVTSMAMPGEVLVSRTVTDLVAGSLTRFEDRGEHELKGVPGTWRLFAVEA